VKLKRTTLIIALALVFASYVAFIAYEFAADPWNEKYKDRVEYPLAKVDANDSSDYMLITWQHSPTEQYEIVTDTQAIKDNKSIFSVDNKGGIYGTTSDGLIWLYKDGILIDTVFFDNTFTKKIEYGTLSFQPTNQLQYLLLLGYVIVEQGDNYSILCNNRNDEPYYYSFAHGDDLHSVEKVYLLKSDSSLERMTRPQNIR
jgi:hypothetical protein